MNPALKLALILGPPCLLPLWVTLLVRHPSEGPFGNAFEIRLVIELGVLAAVVYVAFALYKARTGRGHIVPWFLGAGIAVSPLAYFVLWNAFFRSD